MSTTVAIAVAFAAFFTLVGWLAYLRFVERVIDRGNDAVDAAARLVRAYPRHMVRLGRAEPEPPAGAAP